MDENKTTVLDKIAAFVRGRPADLGAIAQHIGMTPSDAFWATQAAVERGMIREGRYRLYEGVDNHG